MAPGRKGTHVDTFQCYLRDVRLFPLLDPEEEEPLTRLIEEGRKAGAALAAGEVSPEQKGALEELEERGRLARDRLAVANLRLVVAVARRCLRRGAVHSLELLDLIQEGNLALLLAAEAFQPGHGKFATFATPFIRRRIQRAVTNQGRLVRLPVHVREKLNRLRIKETWFLAAKGRPATPEELAAELGVSVAALVELRGAEREIVSVDQPVAGGEEEGLVYADVVEDPEAAVFVQRAEDRRWIDWLLADLDERGRRILSWHLGLGSSYETIGRCEGVSRQRVRQIARDALEKVRSIPVADRPCDPSP